MGPVCLGLGLGRLTIWGRHLSQALQAPIQLKVEIAHATVVFSALGTEPGPHQEERAPPAHRPVRLVALPQQLEGAPASYRRSSPSFQQLSLLLLLYLADCRGDPEHDRASPGDPQEAKSIGTTDYSLLYAAVLFSLVFAA